MTGKIIRLSLAFNTLEVGGDAGGRRRRRGGWGCYYFPFIEEKIEACMCLMWGLMCTHREERSICIRAAQMVSDVLSPLCWPACPVLPLHVSWYSWHDQLWPPGTA